MSLNRSQQPKAEPRIYSHSTRFAKCSVTVSFKQAISSEIAEVLVGKFINVYRVKSMDHRSGPEFHMQRDASARIKYLCIKLPISVKRIDRVLPSCVNGISKTMVTKTLEEICNMR